jgi:hypothetical protein
MLARPVGRGRPHDNLSWRASVVTDAPKRSKKHPPNKNVGRGWNVCLSGRTSSTFPAFAIAASKACPTARPNARPPPRRKVKGFKNSTLKVSEPWAGKGSQVKRCGI